MESRNNKTVYISNLPTSVTEDDLKAIFEIFGACVNCELNLELCTAYFEFENEKCASKALGMNDLEIGSNRILVEIAYKDTKAISEPLSYIVSSEKIDYSKTVQIFVGDIGVDVDESMLKDGFNQFGKILDAKVVRMADGKHRGFAFISFSNKTDAENAIQKMNNTVFHNQIIKCNWATKSKNSSMNSQNSKIHPHQHMKTLDEISNETPQSNTSVYITGPNLTEQFLRMNFEFFGKILTIKAYPDKNHAFINYESHSSAAYAIYQWNNHQTNDVGIKVNWSRKNTSFYGNSGNANTGNFTNFNNNMMENFYQNMPQQYYSNSAVSQQFNNNNTNFQYDQFYRSNNLVSPYNYQQQQQPQQQQAQQFYGNPQMVNYYNNIQQQMQNYTQQINNNNGVYPAQKSITAQSYPYYNYGAGNYNQQYNAYQ